MAQERLEQLEKLQKLREAGALSDDEFLSEKQRLLTEPRSLNISIFGWPIYAGMITALIGATGIGFWATRDAKVPSHSEPSSQMQPGSARETPATVPPRSPAERLADAFEAATGQRSAFAKLEAGETIITKPIRIIELPFGPALLTKREIKDGCHACVGSIGVFYLRELAGVTEVIGRWPKAVEGWGWGAAPTEWYLTDKFTAYPAVYASGGYMGQGVIGESATITELRPGGPITSDVIGTGFSDEGAIVDSERVPCVVEGKVANIRKDQSFDIIVSGSVSAVDHYLKRGGKFVAASRIDWEVPCKSREEDAMHDPFADD